MWSQSNRPSSELASTSSNTCLIWISSDLSDSAESFDNISISCRTFCSVVLFNISSASSCTRPDHVIYNVYMTTRGFDNVGHKQRQWWPQTMTMVATNNDNGGHKQWRPQTMTMMATNNDWWPQWRPQTMTTMATNNNSHEQWRPQWQWWPQTMTATNLWQWRPQTMMATKNNGHRQWRSQTMTATNNNDGHKPWQWQPQAMTVTTMTATNHDNQRHILVKFIQLCHMSIVHNVCASTMWSARRKLFSFALENLHHLNFWTSRIQYKNVILHCAKRVT